MAPTDQRRTTPPVGRLGILGIPWPVLVVAGLMVVGLLAVAGAYGFHGDEMYFVVAGQHPAFGYVDQPPLTPLLSAASVALLGVSPTAVRVLPAIEMGLIVVLTALIARDLGGSRRAQTLAAITAALSGYLGAGHLDTTTDPDLLAWAIIVWLLVKLLAGGDRRLWLALGVTTGIGLENKDTLLFLGAGLAVGLVLTRRWDVIALALGVGGHRDRPPHLGPESRLAGDERLAATHDGAGDQRIRGRQPGADRAAPLALHRTAALPGERRRSGLGALLDGGCSVAGDRDRRPRRARSRLRQRRQGLLRHRQRAALHGCRRHRRRPLAGPRPFPHQGAGLATAAVLSVALIALLTLPILPVAAYAKSGLPAAVPDTANQVGWPEFVSTVEGVVATLPADQRAHAVILTNDYSEASPLVLLGRGLPPVYSGHNSYWSWGPPSDDRTTVVHVGDWRPEDWSQFFVDCRDVAHIDNGLGIENGEQGKAVSVCTGLRRPWAEMWPGLRTIS